MKFSNRRSRRHRNARKKKNQEPPFFSKSNETGAVQAKKEDTFFQAKLRIGQPGDPYEKEADRVAESVVSHAGKDTAVQKMTGEGLQRVAISTPLEDEKLGTADQRMRRDQEIMEKPESDREKEVQMQEEEEEEVQMQEEEEEEVQMQEEEEEEVQMQEEEEEEMQMQEEEEEEMQMQEEEEEEMQMQEEEEEEMQMKKEAKKKGPARRASLPLSDKIEKAKGKGREIPEPVRKKMEEAFGVDLSEVRIHTGKEAEEMNKALGAQAFTVGQDIFFNSGKYNPDLSSGERLLAHELTHVIQQKKGKNVSLRKKEGGASTSAPRRGAGTRPASGSVANQNARGRRSWTGRLLKWIGLVRKQE